MAYESKLATEPLKFSLFPSQPSGTVVSRGEAGWVSQETLKKVSRMVGGRVRARNKPTTGHR